MSFDKSFEKIIYNAECLTPFATAFRYPGVDLEPDLDEVNEAIKMASFIMDFTLEKLIK